MNRHHFCKSEDLSYKSAENFTLPLQSKYWCHHMRNKKISLEDLSGNGQPI